MKHDHLRTVPRYHVVAPFDAAAKAVNALVNNSVVPEESDLTTRLMG